MFNKFIYYRDYFLGYRFGIKYYNIGFLNLRFRIFFYVLESFCQLGCNIFFIANTDKFSLRFFKDLAKTNILFQNKSFYRGILTNDHVYKGVVGSFFYDLENLGYNFLSFYRGYEWEDPFFFYSNLTLISNIKRNIFLVIGDFLSFTTHDIIKFKNNILIFVGYTGINLFYDSYRLFLDLKYGRSFKYIQIIISFILNIFSLNIKNYNRVSFFYNLYKLFKWKRIAWYSSNLFFKRYTFLQPAYSLNLNLVPSLNNYLDFFNVNYSWFFYIYLNITYFSNYYNKLYLLVKFFTSNNNIFFYKRVVFNAYNNNINFFLDNGSSFELSEFKNNIFFKEYYFFFNYKNYFFVGVNEYLYKRFCNKFFFYWKLLSISWLIFYQFVIRELKYYKYFLSKGLLTWYSRSFSLGILNNLILDIRKVIYTWTKSLLSNYSQTVYYFKNLKILNLNYFYNSYFFIKFQYDFFFFKRSYGINHFFCFFQGVTILPYLLFKLEKINFFLFNFDFFLLHRGVRSLVSFFYYWNINFLFYQQWVLNFFWWDNLKLNFLNSSFFFNLLLKKKKFLNSKFAVYVKLIIYRYVFKNITLLYYLENNYSYIMYYDLFKTKLLDILKKKSFFSLKKVFIESSNSFSVYSDYLKYFKIQIFFKLILNSSLFFNFSYQINYLRIKFYFFKFYLLTSLKWVMFSLTYLWLKRYRKLAYYGASLDFLNAKFFLTNFNYNHRQFFIFFVLFFLYKVFNYLSSDFYF